jgi:quercetin dioxygenase-like cupin family protein
MAEPVFQGPGGGEMVDNPLGADLVFKARGDQTQGTMTAFENAVAPGDGPPLHTHANEDESAYVLEGEVRFKLGHEIHAAPAGSFVFIPRGTPHAWQNVGAGPARMLVHFTPSGMERFFEGFAALEAPGPAAFETIGAEVGMDVVGPPLAQSDPI